MVIKKSNNRIKVNQETIADGAWELFAEYGYQNISMSEIAEFFEIKKPSLYHHFKSREAMTKFIIDRQISKVKNLMRKENGDNEMIIKWFSVKTYSLIHLRTQLPHTEIKNIQLIDGLLSELKCYCGSLWLEMVGAALSNRWVM